MCPLPAVVQFLAVVVLILMISHGAVSQLPRINCEPKEPTVRMDDEVTIQCNLTGKDQNYRHSWNAEIDIAYFSKLFGSDSVRIGFGNSERSSNRRFAQKR